MENGWKKLRYYLEYAGVRFLAWSIPKLSRRACVRLSLGLGALAYYLDRKGRKVALANLQAAFGDKYSASEREKIARASYQNFSRTMIDLFWTPRLANGQHERYIIPEDAGGRAAIGDRSRGLVIICAHNAGFEWASLAGGFHGFPMTILTEAFKNPEVGAVFKRLREASGHQIITQEASMIRLLKSVKRGGIAGVLIDFNVRPSQAATVVESFGMKTCVTILPAVLAQRAGARLLPVDSIPESDGTCRIKPYPPLVVREGSTVQEIAQECWNFFEAIIRADPRRWLWAYKYWRFKPKDATRDYPFYANVSEGFDRLIRDVSGRARDRE